MTPEFHYPIPIDRIGSNGFSIRIDASATDLPRIAERLRLPAVGRLGCTFNLRRIGPITIEAAGTLDAKVVEICVVTLDRFEHGIREPFAVHFVPAGTEADDPEPDDIDQLPITGGNIDLGEALVEQLALTLDPYPRKPGAALPAGLGAETSGPFAALLGLRRPS